MKVKKRTRSGSAIAAGAATVLLLGIPAGASATEQAADTAAHPQNGSRAFQASLAEGRVVMSPDYCYPHANDGGCL